MLSLHLQKLSFAYSDRVPLFSNASLHLELRERRLAVETRLHQLLQEPEEPAADVDGKEFVEDEAESGFSPETFQNTDRKQGQDGQRAQGELGPPPQPRRNEQKPDQDRGGHEVQLPDKTVAADEKSLSPTIRNHHATKRRQGRRAVVVDDRARLKPVPEPSK